MADTQRRPRKAAPKKAAKPIGRPSKLTPELATRIVEKLRIGCYVEEAAAACGIAKQSIYGWEKIGAAARDKLDNGETVTDHEAQCASFLDAVEAAQDEWFAKANSTLDMMCFGGIEITSTTTKDGPQGVETTTKVEVSGPNPAVLMWRMERKSPERYGRRAPIDVNLGGQVGNPVQVQVEVSAAELAAKLAAVREDS